MDAVFVFVTKRWYVVAFLAAYLPLALLHLGPRRTALFSGIAAFVSLASEVPSIRVGVPYGLYHYLWDDATGLDHREPSILGVPCFSTLSYVFLNYAALCGASWLLRGGRDLPARAPWRERLSLALGSAALIVAMDMIVDPIALRGEKWFLGRIYLYPGGGEHWGVPITNYLGWLLVGAVIPLAFFAADARGPLDPGSRRGAALGTGLYFGVLLFNIAVTFWVGERDLGWSSVGIALPLAAFSIAKVARGADACHVGQRNDL